MMGSLGRNAFCFAACCSVPRTLGKGRGFVLTCLRIHHVSTCRQLAAESKGREASGFLVSVAPRLAGRGLAWVLGELIAVSALAISLSIPSLFLYFVAVTLRYITMKMQLAECLS